MSPLRTEPMGVEEVTEQVQEDGAVVEDDGAEE